jgi:hypothetical protein
MFKLRNASGNTQVRRHGFGKQVSREHGTVKLVKAALRHRDFAIAHDAL